MLKPLMDLATFEAKAGQVAVTLKAIGNERRLMLLCKLVEHEEFTAGDLARDVGLEEVPQRRTGRLRQGAIEQRPAARPVDEVARLGIPPRQPHPKRGDAQVPLRPAGRHGAEEGAAVEARPGRQVGGDRGPSRRRRHVPPGILDQRD